MQDIVSWILPVTIIPGVGMLILSTSARYIAVNNEVRMLVKEIKPHHKELASQVFRRARCLQQALFALYATITLFVLTGLLVAFFKDSVRAINLDRLLMLLGVCCLAFASMHLVIESFTSLDIIKSNLKKIRDKAVELDRRSVRRRKSS